MLGTVKFVRNADKSKFIHKGRGIAFDGEGSWSFGNDFVRNVKTFDVAKISSSLTDNWT